MLILLEMDMKVHFHFIGENIVLNAVQYEKNISSCFMHFSNEKVLFSTIKTTSNILNILKQIGMLNKYSEIIRSNLNKMQRLKVTAIVTIEVHQRDITEKLIKQGCSDENAFEWLSQLRFYMERVRAQYFV